MNKVIQGAYQGADVFSLILNTDLVEEIEDIDTRTKQKTKGRAGSALIGGLVAGPAGAIVGSARGKKTKTKSFYKMCIYWSDGQKSLVEVNEKGRQFVIDGAFSTPVFNPDYIQQQEHLARQEYERQMAQYQLEMAEYERQVAAYNESLRQPTPADKLAPPTGEPVLLPPTGKPIELPQEKDRK